jgi:hypothetical protein
LGVNCVGKYFISHEVNLWSMSVNITVKTHTTRLLAQND